VLANALFAGPLVAFSSVLARQGFDAGAGLFSVTLAAFGAGGLAGALGLLALEPDADHRRGATRLAIGLGAMVVAAAVVPWAWALPPIAAVAGCTMTASNTLTNTMVQATLGDGKRGQGASVYMLAMRGGAAVGSLATGGLVHALGIRGALALDGALAIAAQVVLARSAWFGAGQRKPA